MSVRTRIGLVALWAVWEGCAASRAPADPDVPAVPDSDEADSDEASDGGDSAPDSPADTAGDGVFVGARSVSVVVRVRYEFTEFGATLCTTYTSAPVCENCEATYRGRGLRPFVEGERVTFRGSWELERSTCPAPGSGLGGALGDALNDLHVWRPSPISPEVFHTFRVDPTASRVVHWVAHAARETRAPVTPALSNQQFWLRAAAGEAWEPGTWCQVHQEAKSVFLGLLPVDVRVAAAFAFSPSTTPPDLRVDDGPPCAGLTTP